MSVIDDFEIDVQVLIETQERRELLNKLDNLDLSTKAEEILHKIDGNFLNMVSSIIHQGKSGVCLSEKQRNVLINNLIHNT